MNRQKLYDQLIRAYSDYRTKNLLQFTYVDRVVKIVKKYLEYDVKKKVERI